MSYLDFDYHVKYKELDITGKHKYILKQRWKLRKLNEIREYSV